MYQVILARGFMRRRRGIGPIINAIKNSSIVSGSTGTTIVNTIIALASANPASTAATAVENGCKIKAIWLSVDFCGLATSAALQFTGAYLIKNVGNNLTNPSPFAVGTSNEKRYVIKEWSAMTMRNQDGNPPYHWEGWVKIPKYHQRMATDDQWQFAIITDTAAGHFGVKWIYKWYS